MGWKEWRYELEKANREYDCGIVDREIYESRVSFAIYMIYKCGNEDAARGIAKAHGYDLEELLENGNRKMKEKMTMTMQSLINIDGNGLKDVLIDLNDKLATAVGWIANKETPEKIAINTYIKEIQEKNYDPVTKAALISNAKKIIKGYYNQSNIVEIARSSLQTMQILKSLRMIGWHALWTKHNWYHQKNFNGYGGRSLQENAMNREVYRRHCCIHWKKWIGRMQKHLLRYAEFQ